MKKILFVRTTSICRGPVTGEGTFNALLLEARLLYVGRGITCGERADRLSLARFWERIRAGLRGSASPDAGSEAFSRQTSAEADDEGEDKGKILFVCTANVCRSPMAEAIFNALVSDAGMPYEARSAGVAALVGEPIAPNARTVLEDSGVRAGKHRARQVDLAMLQEANLVLAMTPQHVAALHHLAGGPLEKIRTLPGYAKDAPDAEGIADPYGMPISAYRASAREIFGYVDRVVRKLRG